VDDHYKVATATNSYQLRSLITYDAVLRTPFPNLRLKGFHTVLPQYSRLVLAALLPNMVSLCSTVLPSFLFPIRDN
jgi:hypothetical protein